MPLQIAGGARARRLRADIEPERGDAPRDWRIRHSRLDIHARNARWEGPRHRWRASQAGGARARRLRADIEPERGDAPRDWPVEGPRHRWRASQAGGARARRLRAGNEEGLALVLVLGMLIIVGMLLASFVRIAGSTRHIVVAEADQARAEALLQTGLTRAIIGLAAPGVAHWPADRSRHNVLYEGGSASVLIEDENGKVDLNYAQPDLMRALFAAALGPGGDPDSLLAAVMARRRAMPKAPSMAFPGPGGPPGVAPPRAFRSVAELRSLPGMDGAAYDALAPQLTVYSGKTTINPRTASEAVLAAVPGLAPADRQGLMAMRNQPMFSVDSQLLGRIAAVQRWLDYAEGPFYTVVVTARTSQGSVAEARTVIWQVHGNFSVLEGQLPLLPVDGTK